MARIQKKYHYIYKTTCLLNNKFYIGMHSADNLNDGYLGSGKRLWRSINYHGKENHIKEIIEFCENREALKKREKEIVNEQLLSEKLCINLQLGGGGGFIDENHMMKTSKRGNEVFLEKMKDEEYRKEFSEKLSKANKEQYLDGRREKKYFYDWNGKKHTDETKKNLSKMRKGTGVGENNSVYGRKWMTKDRLNKMVPPNEIDFYLSEGWEFGKYVGEKDKNILRESFKNIGNFRVPSCKNRKWINKNGKNKRVPINDVDFYLENGWTIGCLINKEK